MEEAQGLKGAGSCQKENTARPERQLKEQGLLSPGPGTTGPPSASSSAQEAQLAPLTPQPPLQTSSHIDVRLPAHISRPLGPWGVQGSSP